MLILGRDPDQSIVLHTRHLLGDDIVITKLKGNRIGIDAPAIVNIRRSELLADPQNTDVAGPNAPGSDDGSKAA